MPEVLKVYAFFLSAIQVAALRVWGAVGLGGRGCLMNSSSQTLNPKPREAETLKPLPSSFVSLSLFFCFSLLSSFLPPAAAGFAASATSATHWFQP